MAYQKKTPFTKGEISGLILRFLKEGQHPTRNDFTAFYAIWKLFPDEKFWRNYKLDFPLNSMFYFLSEEGKERLKTDIQVFNLDIQPEQSYNLEKEKVGEDVVVKRPNGTIADLLRKK
jgi:hypothetical protein